MNDSLIIFTQAERMLAEAVTIQATKELKDLALTAADWAKRKGMGEKAINHARGYALEAERKMGQMLKETERNVGAKGSIVTGNHREPVKDTTPTLADLGLTKKESSKAQALADIPQDKFDEVKQGIKTRTKATQEKNLDKRREAEPQELPDSSYSVIYADPPWKYDHSKSTSRDIENHYPTMTLEEIELLPVRDIAATDSVLFLWATSPKLREAINVLEAWGFKYVTCAVWDKCKIGMGYYFRQQHELLLVGKLGALPTPLPESRVSSVICEARGKHSKKPTRIYGIIEDMYPNERKIELFSRNSRAGWEMWGNEGK